MTEIVRQNSAWPEWKLVRQIGRGSYGRVYEAVRSDFQMESRAAIKVISIPQNEVELDSLRSEGLNMNATRAYLWEVVNDFVQEIRLMEAFKGVQNIVSVEDYKVVEKTDEIGWDIYIRMELLTPFRTYTSDKTMTEQEVAQLGCDICSALEICAKRNVIHRDIKPENIFVNDFGYFKLGDFGIARKLENLTVGLSQKGTGSYMAPEVEKGVTYDATVDLYSLGLVLYRLLNKDRMPFLDTEKQLLSPSERMTAIRRRLDGEILPPPCNASPKMAAIILCACSYDPARRFSTATAMKNALKKIAEDDDYTSQKTAAGNDYVDAGRVEATSTLREMQKPEEKDENSPLVNENSESITGNDSDHFDSESMTGSDTKYCESQEDGEFRDEETRPARRNRKIYKKIFVICILAAVVAAVGFGAYKIQNLQNARYQNYVEEQIASREDREAETAAYEKAINLMPVRLESYYQHAAALYEYALEDGDYNSCIEYIENSILQNDKLDLKQIGMADVYYLYADCYYLEEDYVSSVSAYESLFEIGTEEVLYYRNYAIALACAGNATKADKILGEAEELGLEADGISYTRGEIEKANGDYSAALEDFAFCIENSSDENLIAGAYLNCAAIYSDDQHKEYDLEECREILLEALQNVPSSNQKTAKLLQDLIDADMKLADLSSDNASLYRQEAIEKLNVVAENGWSTAITWYNLAILYQKEGELEQAEEILISVQEDYQSDYRWYKRYAFLEIALQDALENGERDYAQFAEYYNTAVELYDTWLNAGNSTDSEMDVLSDQYEEVQNGGWFS